MASVAKRKWTYNGVEKEAWIVRYLDGTGARRGKQFSKKKEADRFRLKVEMEIEQGAHVAERMSPTIREVAEEYLDQADQRQADGRIGKSRLITVSALVRRYVIPELGHIRFKDLTAKQVEDFYQTLVKRHGLVPYVCRDRVGDLRLIEDFAHRRGYTKAHPVAAALKELRGIRRERIRTFTMDEAVAVLAAAATRVPGHHRRAQQRMECAVNLAAFCGLRRGEIWALDREHVDLKARIVRIRRNLTGHGELKGPKTSAGNRDVPMPPRVVDMLAAFISEFYTENPRGLIFTSEEGVGMSSGNFHLAWRRLLAAAGLDHVDNPFHFHALRHFAASWMIENRLPLTDTAALLGHSKFDMTLQTYAHSVVKPHLRHEIMDSMAHRLTHQ